MLHYYDFQPLIYFCDNEFFQYYGNGVNIASEDNNFQYDIESNHYFYGITEKEVADQIIGRVKEEYRGCYDFFH